MKTLLLDRRVVSVVRAVLAARSGGARAVADRVAAVAALPHIWRSVVEALIAFLKAVLLLPARILRGGPTPGRSP